MALQLKPLEAARGPRWVADAFRLFAKRPMRFTALALVYFFAAMVVRQLPLLGAVIPAMSLPLLSLGFMVAAQSALLGGPVRASQFIEPLRTDAKRRRALLILCATYGVAVLAILLLADAISGHAWGRLQAVVPQGDAGQAQVAAILAEPGVTSALLVGSLLMSLLTVPYWHAPGLVHWGGQGVKQALFSSTVAVWRAKGAFMTYTLAWAGLMLLFGLVAGVVFQLLGAPQLASVLSIPAGLVFSAAFYISVLFTFNDSFGTTPASAQALPPRDPVA